LETLVAEVQTGARDVGEAQGVLTNWHEMLNHWAVQVQNRGGEAAAASLFVAAGQGIEKLGEAIVLLYDWVSEPIEGAAEHALQQAWEGQEALTMVHRQGTDVVERMLDDQG
jgi:hypothetical protein